MHTIRIPKVIQFGENALSEAEYPKNALVVTTAPIELSGKWLDKMGIQDYMVYDKVTPEPSIDDVNTVIAKYKEKKPSVLIGLGGGSSMDVVKYSAEEFGVEKILIPTTFGTGAEMTTYCVLKFDGKKKLLHEDRFLADRALVVTTAPIELSGKWLDRMGIQDYMVYDKVTPEPSIDDVNTVIAKYKEKKPSVLIGLGGGSSMDVVKYSAEAFGVEKILIPTTFGTGAEMTTYCVLKFDGKKKLLREDRFLADRAIVDSYFMDGTPEQIIKNSVCDACAQATEGYDSKLGNNLTRTLCKHAFDVLYDAIINDKPENYPYGSMLSGMGFGNCSTTLGHALSYVFSNEGVAHGFSLSSCTTIAHKHNNSIFYEKFKQVIEKLGFDKMKLKAPVDEAADVVMTDKGHLDPNPIPISKEDVIKCLNAINDGNL